MKLYELKRGDSFKLTHDVRVPPAAPEGRMGVEYEYLYVDGMYANVYDPDGNRLYFSAYTEVEEV